jgi:hypothetical protein
MVGVQVGEHHVIDLGGIGLARGQIARQITGVGSQRVTTAGIDEDSPASTRDQS